MAFGIMRIRKLKIADLEKTDLHNARKYKTLEEYPENIDPKKNHLSRYYEKNSSGQVDELEFPKGEKGSLSGVVKNRIEKEGVQFIRKNTNVAIEYVSTISDKKAWNKYSPKGFFSNTQQWIEKRHGKGSVVASYEHLDESNPHVHFVVVPIIKKTVKWKNKSRQGEKIENRLNVRDYVGSPQKLRKLQDDFFNHLVETYGKDANSKLGVPLYRGTLVENQTREYTQKTNHKLGILMNEIEKVSGVAVRNLLEAELFHQKGLKEIAEKKLQLLQEQKRRKSQSWKNIGTKDNPEIFHGETTKRPRKGPKL